MSLSRPPSKLLGPNGQPISSDTFGIENKKAAPPKTGHAFGDWAGRDISFATLPGGGVVQFDLSKLTVADFRNMRDHYQVNVSLQVLSFMQHQSEFHIECEDKKIAEACDVQMHEAWTYLNRTMAQANWAGYSPGVLEWDNNILKREVVLDKVLDLIPEECRVHWDLEEGWAPPGRVKPKFKKFGGITQFPGTGWPIPVESSFWYPILMENGNYNGRKLLRSAFQSWFFSMLIHLFANRYFERFGEPTPVGRAPFEDSIDVGDGTQVNSARWMLSVLQDLRNRSVVVLPNDKSDPDANGRPTYDYDISYLESQMRGADFERYLTRLDEEVSLALFTPILLMRTADVGSYDLGKGHMQMYLWMMNAMNADRKIYIDRYILSRMVDYNFSPNAPRAKIVFDKLDGKNSETKYQVLLELVKKGAVAVDVQELGQDVGMTLKEIKQTTTDSGADPAADPSDDPAAPDTSKEGDDTGDGNGSNNRVTVTGKRAMRAVHATAEEMADRIKNQAAKAFRENTFGSDRFNMGFRNRMTKAMEADGILNYEEMTDLLFANMDAWLADVSSIPHEEFSSSAEFAELFAQVLGNEIDSIA